MIHKTFHFRYSELDIDLMKIESVLGYGEGNDRDIVNAVVAGLLAGPELFSNIKAEYTIFSDIAFLSADKSITIDNVNFQTHKVLFNQLKKAGSIAVFLSTAGKEVGIKTKKAMAEGDPLTGYICDMLGSLVADAAADLMQADLEKMIFSEGKKITNRFSPGYCGWDVSEQHKLFRLVPGNYCGINLTDSALMNPIKSISGFIGIGEKVKFNPYPCSFCEMTNCAYREAPEKKAC